MLGAIWLSVPMVVKETRLVRAIIRETNSVVRIGTLREPVSCICTCELELATSSYPFYLDGRIVMKLWD